VEVALSELVAKERYRLLIGLVVPRPIAFITTRGEDGVVNAAPFSFFNLMGEDPPIVVVSLESRADGSIKDTMRNIRRSGEFVINLVDEAIAAAMHQSSADYPPEVSEIAAVGLGLASCRDVAVERIAEAPASLECRVLQTVAIRPTRRIVIGEILRLHVRDTLVDPATKRIREDDYHPVGRLYGNSYVRTRERFSLPPAIP
jgi:flavin reductase (DIM6/NTAB) family NADH-FMN oxidoreductase RutF